MIRNMLALEEARYDFTNGTMKKKDDRTVQEYKNEFLATLPPPPPPPPKSPDKPKQSVVTVNGRKVTVDQILNDINNRLNAKDPNRLVPQDKSTAASKYILASSSSQTPKVFANTTPASYVVASNSINRTSTSISVPTPTHILKGATYYNETKGSKDDKPAFTSNDFPISTDGVCPYCRSSDVVYIILQDDNEKEQFPDLLKWLFQEGKAVKRKKGFLFSNFNIDKNLLKSSLLYFVFGVLCVSLIVRFHCSFSINNRILIFMIIKSRKSNTIGGHIKILQ